MILRVPFIALLATLVAAAPAIAQDSKRMSEKDCRSVEFPSSEQRLVRACDANYGLCANPPPAWQQIRQVMAVCEQIRRERQLQAAGTPGLSPQVLSRSTTPALNAAMPAAASVAAPASAANLSSPWRINGNGFPGEVTLQQAPDGTLSGSIYGEPLTGYYAPGEGVGVWLRGAPTQPIQAFIGQATPDGSSFAGRFYGLNASSSGATPQRNVFAFAALRAAPSHPGHPGVPNAAAGPASVGGTLPLVANGHAGQLVLSQAPDGSLSGSLYGDRLTGHYAQGTGSIAFLRFTGAQPVQLYIGNVSAQGISGEFYALTGGAGATPQRMRFSWSAQAPAATLALSAQATQLLARGNVAAPPGGSLVAPAQIRQLPKSGDMAVPVTITCPPNGNETGRSRHAGWNFETIWQVLLQTQVANPASMNAGTVVSCQYGDTEPPPRQAAELFTLKRNAGPGITAAMCAVAGGTFNCQGGLSFACPPNYTGDVASSARRPGWTVATTGAFPLLRASATDPPSMGAGTVLQCVYGTPANVPRPRTLFTLSQNAGAGTTAAACKVNAPSVTCTR
jgi:hypothetical protein